MLNGLNICMYAALLYTLDFKTLTPKKHEVGSLESTREHNRVSYDQGSYNQWFLQSGVLTIRGLTIRDSYNQGFLRSGVLTIRGSYDQGFLRSGVLQPGVLTIRGSYDYKQGFKSTCLT